MTHRKSILAVAVMVAASTLSHASAVSLDQLQVKDSLYPEDFRDGLQNNLNFFVDGVGVDTDAVVPYDTIWVKDGKITHGYYTNTTEIGLYLSILVEVEKAGNSRALTRIAEVIDTLETAPKFKGLFYWPYDIINGKLTVNKDKIVPAVDNGNLALALAGVAGAYIDSEDTDKQAIVKRIDALLAAQKQGWSAMYDSSRGLLIAGWKSGKPLPYFIDRKANESRTASLWAPLITRDMGKKAVPTEAFKNKELYTAIYTVNGKAYNPILTWDGAYFQAMLPAIWLEEESLIPDYGMFEDMTKLQMMYAAKHNIPMVSSAATVDDQYAAFGIPFLSESKVKFNNEISGASTGTPHAVALSYMIDPKSSVSALKGLKRAYPQIESVAGWYDAVDTHGNMSTKILSLDQGMFVGAFLSDSINQDVQRYMEAKNYWHDVQAMYKSFIPTIK